MLISATLQAKFEVISDYYAQFVYDHHQLEDSNCLQTQSFCERYYSNLRIALSLKLLAPWLENKGIMFGIIK